MRRRVIVLLSLVALVAAGCGGDDNGGGGSGTSKQEYGRQLSRATGALQQVFQDLAKSTGQTGSIKDSGERLQRGATALDQAADDFDDIQPPKESTGAHDKLVAGLHDLAATFRKGAEAAKHNDADGLQQALQGLTSSKGVREITEAQQELERQGVKVTTTAG